MNKVLTLIDRFSTLFADVPPLILRLIVAHGFFGPALTKLKNLSAFADWLAKLGVPAPSLNAYMSVTTEVAGVLLMVLGLGTRIMSIPMMGVMVVAITTVHWNNGFSCGHNGFQIPLYYLLMLVCILIMGPGRFSFDDVIRNKLRRKQ
jgi:putative oxidoreductase